MEAYNFARIMIAGTGSSCGKTTVTCVILKALVNRNIKTAAFKCGPDYIDPMFHTEIIGTSSRNLDTFLCGENAVKYLYSKNSKQADISVVEGVMGFYDGMGNDGSYSSYAMSKLTGTPVVLVVNGKGMSLSIVAMIKGYVDFMPNNIKGVIINDIYPGTYPMYKEMIEELTQLKVLGFLPSLPEAMIESRHLGLITAGEIENLHHKLNLLANSVEKYIELDSLLELAKTAQPLEYEPIDITSINIKENMDYEKQKAGSSTYPSTQSRNYCCNIAVAKDEAFCFYYQHMLEFRYLQLP
jgi:cobyrinic acid a,c-diamide synthase